MPRRRLVNKDAPGQVAEPEGEAAGMTSIFLFVSGATPRVDSAERLIGSFATAIGRLHRLVPTGR